MPATRIWVVITDGVNTRICSCQEGIAMPLAAEFLEESHSDDRDVRACHAWFKAEGQQRLSRNSRRQHLLHVSQVLLEGARNEAFDGLIVIAAEPIAAELKQALAPETRALLIGRIVRDLPAFEPAASGGPLELRH